MKRFRQIGGILLAGCLLLAGGCVNLSQLKQPGVETAFYTLEYEAPQINARGIDCILRVKPFTATPLFNTSTIVYRGKPNETAEYIYHRWHMTPAEMTGDCLARDLKQSGLFKAVFSPSSLMQADYVVEGHIYQFLENDTVSPWRAELALVITFLDKTKAGLQNQLLMQKRYAVSKKCVRNNPRSLAKAMSRAMKTVSGRIIKDIHRHLAEERQSRQP